MNLIVHAIFQANMTKAEETANSMAIPTLRLLTESEAASLVEPVELVELEAVSWMVEGICPSAHIREFNVVKEANRRTDR